MSEPNVEEILKEQLAADARKNVYNWTNALIQTAVNGSEKGYKESALNTLVILMQQGKLPLVDAAKLITRIKKDKDEAVRTATKEADQLLAEQNEKWNKAAARRTKISELETKVDQLQGVKGKEDELEHAQLELAENRSDLALLENEAAAKTSQHILKRGEVGIFQNLSKAIGDVDIIEALSILPLITEDDNILETAAANKGKEPKYITQIIDRVVSDVAGKIEDSMGKRLIAQEPYKTIFRESVKREVKDALVNLADYQLSNIPAEIPVRQVLKFEEMQNVVDRFIQSGRAIEFTKNGSRFISNGQEYQISYDTIGEQKNPGVYAVSVVDIAKREGVDNKLGVIDEYSVALLNQVITENQVRKTVELSEDDKKNLLKSIVDKLREAVLTEEDVKTMNKVDAAARKQAISEAVNATKQQRTQSAKAFKQDANAVVDELTAIELYDKRSAKAQKSKLLEKFLTDHSEELVRLGVFSEKTEAIADVTKKAKARKGEAITYFLQEAQRRVPAKITIPGVTHIDVPDGPTIDTLGKNLSALLKKEVEDEAGRKFDEAKEIAKYKQALEKAGFAEEPAPEEIRETEEQRRAREEEERKAEIARLSELFKGFEEEAETKEFIKDLAQKNVVIDEEGNVQKQDDEIAKAIASKAEEIVKAKLGDEAVPEELRNKFVEEFVKPIVQEEVQNAVADEEAKKIALVSALKSGKPNDWATFKKDEKTSYSKFVKSVRRTFGQKRKDKKIDGEAKDVVVKEARAKEVALTEKEKETLNGIVTKRITEDTKVGAVKTNKKKPLKIAAVAVTAVIIAGAAAGAIGYALGSNGETTTPDPGKQDDPVGPTEITTNADDVIDEVFGANNGTFFKGDTLFVVSGDQNGGTVTKVDASEAGFEYDADGNLTTTLSAEELESTLVSAEKSETDILSRDTIENYASPLSAARKRADSIYDAALKEAQKQNPNATDVLLSVGQIESRGFSADNAYGVSNGMYSTDMNVVVYQDGKISDVNEGKTAEVAFRGESTSYDQQLALVYGMAGSGLVNLQMTGAGYSILNENTTLDNLDVHAPAALNDRQH